MLLGQPADLPDEIRTGKIIPPLPLNRLHDDEGYFGGIDQADVRVQEMLQAAPHSFLPGAADRPAARAFPVLTGAVGEVNDVRDLGEPVALDFLAAVQGESAQGAAMESPVEADPVAVVLFVVVADLDGILDSLGAAFGGKAAKMQEYICGLPAQYEKLAELAGEDLRKMEKVRFSWICGREA